jgi:DNA polymerase III delta prime subunit
MEEFLFVEKFRPRKVADCILPSKLKNVFQSFVDQGNVPNLILTGTPGVGKTTIARAMLEQIGSDYIIINGSMNGNIDTLRNEIKMFASSISFTGARKYVILDEADYLNPNSTQPALRNFMEEFSANCGFILTCNYPQKIIKELHSRATTINFVIDAKEKADLALEMFNNIKGILAKENIKVTNDQVLGEVILKFFPDMRRMLNEIQAWTSHNKTLDVGILGATDGNFKPLIDFIKAKKFNEIRQWIAESNVDFQQFYSNFITELAPKTTDKSVPGAVVILAEYQYKAAFVADQQLNMLACIVELMNNVVFK